MAIPNVITSQSGGRQFDGTNLTKYSMFVGGVNATNNALRQYTPLVNGYCRLFMVRPPYAIMNIFAGGNSAYLYSSDSLFVQFKHMLEYMNRSVTGIQSKQLEQTSTTFQGGFAGRSFNVPTVTKETTNSITISMYEFAGCPVGTVLDTWINAIGDENSGLATYGGYISGGRNSMTGEEIPLFRYSGVNTPGIPFNEANHTCEFIYVLHDRSGAQVERALLLADCYPKGWNQTQIFDMQQGGTHDLVSYDVEFNCIAYSSPLITAIANDLLKQYRIVSNHLNFNPELGDAVYGDTDITTFNRALGEIPSDSVNGTSYGNLPVYNPTNEPKVTNVIIPPDNPAGTALGLVTAQSIPVTKSAGAYGSTYPTYQNFNQQAGFTGGSYIRDGSGKVSFQPGNTAFGIGG